MVVPHVSKTQARGRMRATQRRMMRLYFCGMFFNDAGTVGASVNASISRTLSASLMRDQLSSYWISTTTYCWCSITSFLHRSDSPSSVAVSLDALELLGRPLMRTPTRVALAIICTFAIAIVA